MNAVLQSVFGFLKIAWRILAPIIVPKVIDFINNKANQKAARDAVISAMKDGLKDNAAFDQAADELKKSFLNSGKQVAQVVIDTLIQNAYLAVKCENMSSEQMNNTILDIK